MLPTIKESMAATQVGRAFHREGWVYEEKVDGWRMLLLMAYKDGDRVIHQSQGQQTQR